MGEVPLRFSILESGDSFLTDEVLPTFVPGGDARREGRLVGLRERMDEDKEFLASLGLGTAREIPSDNLDLMELTDLHRHVLKYLEKPSSSVDYGRFEYPPFLLKYCPAIAIVGHELAGDFVPPDILCERPSTEGADAIVATPEGGVGNEHGSMRRDRKSRYDNCIELFAYPDM